MAEVYNLNYLLPCLKNDFSCPYADTMGKERNWTCCGVRPPARMTTLRECPQKEKVEAMRAKGSGNE